MEALSEEIWDLVIAGTSLPQSLLALSLSRSGKKVLHVDCNDYYGGNDAGFSLQEAETWAQHVSSGGCRTFSNASLSDRHNESSDSSHPPLASSRSYTLSLNPQIIYAQSSFLPALVSSQIHTQLEFLAVGLWWVLRNGILHKIPSTREDVFSDDTLSMRDKRSLMKFLRFVVQQEEQEQLTVGPPERQSLQQALERRFNVPESLQTPILALALSLDSASEIDFDTAHHRIRRHMQSIGYFGQGFGAVIAKYGGNAEIAQVACRAQAVGGGVYLLGRGIRSLSSAEDSTHRKLLQLTLSDGTPIKCRRVAGSVDDLPQTDSDITAAGSLVVETFHSISIVSDTLKTLFPQISENGPVPAAAIVLVEDASELEAPPVYLQVHSEDTGECPPGQCVIYACVQHSKDSSDRIHHAVNSFLRSFSERPPSIVWSLAYVSRGPASHQRLSRTSDLSDEISVFNIPNRPFSIALENQILDNVRAIWEVVTGSETTDETFLRFQEREQDPDPDMEE